MEGAKANTRAFACPAGLGYKKRYEGLENTGGRAAAGVPLNSHISVRRIGK